MSLDWINDFTPAQSDGTLPLEGTAGAMRYKRAIIWNVDVGSWGIGGGNIRGSWEVTIEAPGGRVLFHQEVVADLHFIYYAVPTLAFYTWNFFNDNSARTATDIIDGEPVLNFEIKDFLINGVVQSTMLPAEGQGNTDLTATIIADWYSPGYLFPSGIPPGSTVTIGADKWDLGPASVEYSWAFGPGSAMLDALTHPATGQTFLLHMADGELKLARTRRGHPTLALRETPDTDEDEDETSAPPLPPCDFEASITTQELVPNFAKLYRYNGVLYCVTTAEHLQLYCSVDDGKNWKELASMPMDELNITITACAFDSNGAKLYLYGTTTDDEPAAKLTGGNPMFVELKNQGNSWKLATRGEVLDGDKPKPPPPPEGDEEPVEEPTNDLPTNNVARMEYADGKLYLVAKTSDNSLSIYISVDGLRSLRKLQIS